MSNGRRARRSVRGYKHDPWYSVMVGWCASYDELDETRQKLHDSLIAGLGPKRRGGVTWSWKIGAEAVEMIDKLADPETEPELLDYYAKVRSFLTERGGLLVIARAKAIR